MQFVVSK